MSEIPSEDVVENEEVGTEPVRSSEFDAPPHTDEVEGRDEPKRSRLGRLARRLMNTQELGEDAREVLGAMLETSDRAKSEVVKMAAREVRTYLEALKLKEDLLELVRSHSLELHVSMNLKPLEAALTSEEEQSEPTAEASEE